MNKTRRIACALLTLALLIPSSLNAVASETAATEAQTSEAAFSRPTPPDIRNGQTLPYRPGGQSESHQAPPAMPNGETPDGEQPGGGMPGGQIPGGTPGGGMEDASGGYTLTGVLSADGETLVYDGQVNGDELSSASSDENVVLAQNGAQITLSNVSLNKSGDSENNDATDFYAVNAVVTAKSGSVVEIADTLVNSAARGGNCLFASGEGSAIYAQNVTIHSASNNSRGLDATYGGTVVADNLQITTEGAHSGAVATDRGNGSISIANSTLSAAGQGSPLIYSTGTIEAINVTGEATGAQIVGMEGLNKVRILQCDLTGSGEKASEPIATGVFLYQSMSGDSSEGTALFEALDSTLTSHIQAGAMFYVTNTTAEVVLQNTALHFDADNNYLIVAGGNNSNNWGVSGQNGGALKFTAIGETLAGNILCDGISQVDLYLTDASTYTGAVERDETYDGDGGVLISLSADSRWIVTADCALNALNNAGTIVDAEGKTVSIAGTDGTVYVKGDSSITVTVGSYAAADETASAGVLSDTEVDRSHFNA